MDWRSSPHAHTFGLLCLPQSFERKSWLLFSLIAHNGGCKAPIATVQLLEVLVLNTVFPFLGMSAFSPLPKRFVNFKVYTRECFWRCPVVLIVIPAGYHAVEHPYHRRCLCRLISLDFRAYLVAETLHRIFWWLGKQLFIRMFADVEAEEVKALLMWVILVFSSESIRPRSSMNCRTSGRIISSIVSLSFAVIIKSSV